MKDKRKLKADEQEVVEQLKEMTKHITARIKDWEAGKGFRTYGNPFDMLDELHDFVNEIQTADWEDPRDPDFKP
jgi:hypothetical protein